MFSKIKQQVRSNFDTLSRQKALFYVTIDRNKIFEQYLSGFPDAERQKHNCNCCKSFLRQFGGIVAIIDNKKVSIWDNVETDESFRGAIGNLQRYIHSLPITDIFLTDNFKCGTDKSRDGAITWEHFYIEVPGKFMARGEVDAKKGAARDNKNVLKRSLDEFTVDATETILELIAQNSLYRGTESKGLLEEFLKMQKEYRNVIFDRKELFCWVKSTEVSQGMSRIRNHAIGTLLENVSLGLDLDVCLGKWESVMAPSNYKRPTGIATPAMQQKAKDRIIELGMMDSLQRRYATQADLNIQDVLFTDKSTNVFDTVFDELKKETLINPRTLSKVEEVSISDFVSKVLPTATQVEVLLQKELFGNFVSLVGAEYPDAPSLFSWNNPFSWSYSGGIADSIKERVKAAGGNVDGVLRFSIQWNEEGDNNIDFDAHSVESDGNQIYYANCRQPGVSRQGGQLDVDIQSPGDKVAVENITWNSLSKLKAGVIKLKVHNFSSRTSNAGFKAEVAFEGKSYTFEYPKNLKGSETIEVAEVTYHPNAAEKFTVKGMLPIGEKEMPLKSEKKWNLGTYMFHKVKNIALSPNYWKNAELETGKGNKHFFFFLEDCISDETPRAFYNEFLKPEFTPDRKAFEMVGGKLKVPHAENQLSGLGFSETQRNKIYVRVTGKFTRTLAINF